MSEQTGLELQAPAPELTFDEKEHRYHFGGVEWPGVTRALEEARIIDFSMVPRHILLAAQERGTRVHNAIHYWLDGDLDPDSVDERDHGYLMGAIAFMNQYRVTPTRVERFIHSIAHRFAGRLDLEALLERSRPGHDLAVIDWKTGLYQPAHRIQLASYASGLQDPRAYRRITVELHKDGTFKPHEYPPETYLRDLNVFHGAVVGWHWKNDAGQLRGQRPVYSYAL